MLDKLKIAAVLLLIGAFSGGFIYLINDWTAPYIAANEKSRKVGFFSEIFEVEASDIYYKTCVTTDDLVDDEHELRDVCPTDFEETFIYSKVDDTLLGTIYAIDETNSYGSVSVLVGINADGSFANVVISGSTNTPNFVKRIENKFLAAFTEFNTTNVEFDSNTGATYTYSSVKSAVVKATEYFNTERGND